MSYYRTDILSPENSEIHGSNLCELSEVSMSSPPQKVLAPSDFMSCSGLVKDKPKGYKSFPESGHTKSVLDFRNESISDFHSSNGTGNKYNGFGSVTFPSSNIRSMDFAIHDSSNSMSALSSKSSGWNCSVIFRYKSIRHV
jgi:hypothetical protein